MSIECKCGFPAGPCWECANDAVRKLEEALEKIVALDPAKDSDEGFNEWGEADCFGKAQSIATEALK